MQKGGDVSLNCLLYTSQDAHIDVYMLTGDNEITAQAIASSAGITHVIAQVLSLIHI